MKKIELDLTKILDDETIAMIAEKIFAQLEPTEEPEGPHTPEEILAYQFGMSIEEFEKYFQSLYKLYPQCLASMLLKVIAIEFDKNYKGHISDSEHIFIISLTDGNIREYSKKFIKNYNNFAAFRTYKDALEAKNLILPLFNELFPE